ncbi:MAG: hypothetical protein JSW73_02670 [Candidatus Woesearchaeota archaeon]|nr:MAG: hypothetical protein JSW73_02670 [Candidatus Woesearchaeota archaeon]
METKSIEDMLKESDFRLHKGSLKKFLDDFGELPTPKNLKCLEAFDPCDDIVEANEFYFYEESETYHDMGFIIIDVVDNYKNQERVHLRSFLKGKVNNKYLRMIDFSDDTAKKIIVNTLKGHALRKHENP